MTGNYTYLGFGDFEVIGDDTDDPTIGLALYGTLHHRNIKMIFINFFDTILPCPSFNVYKYLHTLILPRPQSEIKELCPNRYVNRCGRISSLILVFML